MRRTFLVVFALLLAAYFALRLLSGVTIDQPVETKAGLQQRAAAAQKLLRYNGWLSGWIGSSVLGPVILWPIVPTSAEAEAAGEFASAVLGAHRTLERAGFVCGGLAEGQGGAQSPQQVELIAAVAGHVRAEDTQWADPPTVTLLVPIRAKFPCEQGERQ